MTDRPIIFSAPMVRALLDGRKSQTRRLAWTAFKPDIAGDFLSRGWRLDGGTFYRPSPWQRVQPGDRLWVKCAFDAFPVYHRRIEFGGGKYAVGTDGLVYDVSGTDPRPCASHTNHNGYEEITLRFNGEQRSFRVNRLVAEAFYGPPPQADAVTRHMDGNRQNNRPENLDWGSPAENTADANALGRWSGEENGAAKLTAEAVAAIRISSEPQATLAERFGVTQPTISKIKSGKRWRQKDPTAPPRNAPAWAPWLSVIHCPRWASRLTLVVTEVRRQRLQEISEEDAIAEGVYRHKSWGGAEWFRVDGLDVPGYASNRARDVFAFLWGSLHGNEGWHANPEVVCLSFRCIARNIDALEKAA